MCQETIGKLIELLTDDQRHEMRYFEFEHLPPHLAEVSAEFYAVAVLTMVAFEDSAQRQLALTHLLQAKDAAVRCAVDKQKGAS